jgi:hypothetical protein
MSKLGLSALVALLLALGVLEPSARAQSRADTDACIEAHVDGQRYVKEGKLRDAAAQFEQCAADQCPKVVRRDCAKLVAETRAQIPSVLLDISDHQGRPVTDATIVIDGKATEAKSGEAVELDPGKHWARVINKQGRSVEVTFDLEPAERDVRVKASLPAPPAKPTPAPVPRQQTSGVPPATWVSGGVAIVGFLGFALFALSGSGKESDLDACKPDCNDRSVYDDMKRDYLIADVSLAIGLAAAGVGAYFYFSSDDGSEASPPASAWARPRALSGGGVLDLGLSF